MFGLFKKRKTLPLVTFDDLVSKVVEVNKLNELASEWQQKGSCERLTISEDRVELTLKVDLDPLKEMIGSFAKTDSHYYMYTAEDFMSFLLSEMEKVIRSEVDKMGILPSPFVDFLQEAALLPLLPDGVTPAVIEKPPSFMKGQVQVSAATLLRFYPHKAVAIQKGSSAFKLNVVFNYEQHLMKPITRHFWILNSVILEDHPQKELVLPGYKNAVVQDMYNLVKDLGNPNQRVQSFIYKGQFFIVAHGLKETVIYSETISPAKNYNAFCNCSEPHEDLSIINRLGKLAKLGLSAFDLGEGWIVRWYKHDTLTIHHSPEY